MERRSHCFWLLAGGRLGIAPQSLARMKEPVRGTTGRNRGVSFERVIQELNGFLTGRATYFHYAGCKGHLQRLDEWIRRQLRCACLKQRRRAKSIADFLPSLGVPTWRCPAKGGGARRAAHRPPQP